jgi:hypothetical protein
VQEEEWKSTPQARQMTRSTALVMSKPSHPALGHQFFHVPSVHIRKTKRGMVDRVSPSSSKTFPHLFPRPLDAFFSA